MNTLIRSAFFFVLLGAATGLSAQKIYLTVSPEMEVEESISGGEVSAVSAAAEDILNQYAQLGHMTNDQGVTTRLAGNNFKGLFKATARIFADYLEYPGGIGDDIAAYRQTVMQRFPDRGFPYNIGNAELTKITGEGYRFYIVTMRFNKSIKAYIDGNGRIRTAERNGSRDFILELTAEISTDDLSQFRIRSITCADKCGKKAADRVRYLSTTATLGLPLTSVKKIGGPGISSGQDSYEFKHDIQLGIGARFTSNLLSPDGASGKHLFLTGGLNLTYSKFTSSLNSYALESFPDPDFNGESFEGNIGAYRRTVDDVFLTEETKLLSVEVPLGVSYRILENYERALMLEAVIKPSFVFSKSLDWKNGRGVFDGVIDVAKFSVLENSEYVGATNPDDNPFNVCDCDQVTRSGNSDLETGLGLWVQLSPTFYSNVDNNDPALGFQISLDFAFNLKSPLTSSAADNPILQAPRGETNILSNAYFDTKLHYVGLRAGVFLQRARPINIR